MKNKEIKRSTKRGVILLEDLAPNRDIKGGSGKILFGEGADPAKGLFFPRLLLRRKRSLKRRIG